MRRVSVSHEDVYFKTLMKNGARTTPIGRIYADHFVRRGFSRQDARAAHPIQFLNHPVYRGKWELVNWNNSV